MGGEYFSAYKDFRSKEDDPPGKKSAEAGKAFILQLFLANVEQYLFKNALLTNHGKKRRYDNDSDKDNCTRTSKNRRRVLTVYRAVYRYRRIFQATSSYRGSLFYLDFRLKR